MTNPRPRPALRKSDDASVHPAAARLEDREVADSDSQSEQRRKKSDKSSERPSDKASDKSEKQLVLDLPKPLRKRLKAEAVTLGTTPAALAVEILQRWADDGPTGSGRRRKG